MNYIKVTAFGGQAEFANKYFNKGKRVAVTGELMTGSYKDEETGKTMRTMGKTENKKNMHKNEMKVVSHMKAYQKLAERAISRKRPEESRKRPVPAEAGFVNTSATEANSPLPVLYI